MLDIHISDISLPKTTYFPCSDLKMSRREEQTKTKHTHTHTLAPTFGARSLRSVFVFVAFSLFFRHINFPVAMNLRHAGPEPDGGRLRKGPGGRASDAAAC